MALLGSVIIPPVKPTDIPATATLCSAAMVEDELIRYLCPYRYHNQIHCGNTIYDVWSRDTTGSTNTSWLDGIKQEGTPSNVLLGYAAWRREGIEAESWKKENSWLHGNFIQVIQTILYLNRKENDQPSYPRLDFERQALRLTNRYLALFYLDR